MNIVEQIDYEGSMITIYEEDNCFGYYLYDTIYYGHSGFKTKEEAIEDAKGEIAIHFYERSIAEYCPEEDFLE